MFNLESPESLKKQKRAEAESFTRAQLLEEIQTVCEFFTSADLRRVESSLSVNQTTGRTEIEHTLSREGRRRYRKDCVTFILRRWNELTDRAHEIRSDRAEREKNFCTRTEIVREAQIGGGCFDRYVASGAVIPATQEDGVRPGLYRRESIHNILAEKAANKTADYCTRGQVVSDAHISESYFQKYLAQGLIIPAPDRKGMYLRESVQRVLEYKENKRSGKTDKKEGGGDE